MRYRALSYLILAFIALGFGVPYALTSSAGSCAYCHAMKPYYESWKRSTHEVAAPSCTVCHVKNGFAESITFRVLFWREIYSWLVGASIPPLKSYLPGNDICVKSGCHSLNRTFSTSRELKINHRFHIVQARLKCIVCHPGVVHEGVGRLGKKIPPRKLCFRCHKSVSKNCQFCHLKPVEGTGATPHGQSP